MADLFLRTRIGDIMLDAEIAEGHASDMRITDNPVESGAEVSDHAVLVPKTVTIEGVIVDYEPLFGDLMGLSAMVPRTTADFLNLLPLVTNFETLTAQAKVYADRALSSYQALSSDLSKEAAKRALAPWLPGLSDMASDLTGAGSRAQRIYDSLLRLQKSGETMDIQTGLRLYKNMLLPAISAMEEQRGSAHVTIYARELFIVESKTITGVQVASAGKSKSGRAGAQSAAKASKGNTNPADLPADKNNSALSSIGGLFK